MCIYRHCQAELLYKVSETLILSISQPLFATSAHRHLNWINLGYTDRCRGPVKWAPDGVFTRHSLPVCLLHFTPGWQREVTTGANLSAVFLILNTLLLLFFRCRIFYYMHLGMILMALTHVIVLWQESGLSLFVVLDWNLSMERWKVLNIRFHNHCSLQILTNWHWLDLYW